MSVLPYCYRSTGAYVQILFQVLLRDMIQFGTIFAVFLFSFSGAFYLALRGEVKSIPIDNNTVNTTLNNDTNVTSFDETNFTTNLDLYPFETAYVVTIDISENTLLYQHSRVCY